MDKILKLFKRFGPKPVTMMDENPALPDGYLRHGDSPGDVGLEVLLERSYEAAKRSSAAFRYTRRAINFADALDVDTKQLLERLGYVRQYPEDFCNTRPVIMPSPADAAAYAVEEPSDFDKELEKLAAKSPVGGSISGDEIARALKAKNEMQGVIPPGEEEAAVERHLPDGTLQDAKFKRWEKELETAGLRNSEEKDKMKLLRKKRPKVVAEQRAAMMDKLKKEMQADIDLGKKIVAKASPAQIGGGSPQMGVVATSSVAVGGGPRGAKRTGSNLLEVAKDGAGAKRTRKTHGAVAQFLEIGREDSTSWYPLPRSVDRQQHAHEMHDSFRGLGRARARIRSAPFFALENTAQTHQIQVQPGLSSWKHNAIMLA